MSTLTVTNINTDILKIDSITAKTVDANLVLTSSNTEAGTLTIRNTGGLTFVHNSSATSNAIAINSQGNVGIGTSSAPNAKLQIVGAANVSGNVVISGTANIAGNTVISGTANVSGNLKVSTNTFTLGTSSLTANGYTYLPNGLIFQWGEVTANSSSAGDITFPIPFTTSLYSITTTCLATVNSTTYNVNLLAANTTTANVRSANATSRSVYWQAIGI